MKKILIIIFLFGGMKGYAQSSSRAVKLPFDKPYYILDTIMVEGYSYGDGEDYVFYFDTIGVTEKNWHKLYHHKNNGYYCDEYHSILTHNMDNMRRANLLTDDEMIKLQYGKPVKLTKYLSKVKVKGLAMVYLLNNDMQLDVLESTVVSSEGLDINPHPTRVLKKLGKNYYIPAISFVVAVDWQEEFRKQKERERLNPPIIK